MSAPTQQTLHLTSGDMIAVALREADIAGRIEPVREAIVDGPLPVGPTDADWEEARARWLAGRYGLDAVECDAEQIRLTLLLDDAAKASDVVLWFDDDLFCQRTLLMVLHRIAVKVGEADQPLIRIASIRPETGTGPARDTVSPADALTAAREVSSQTLAAASDAWHVVAAQDAAEIAALGAELSDRGETALARALELELRWRVLRVRSRVEIARLIGEDGASFEQLFARWQEAHPELGLGDWQVWLLAAAAVQRESVAITGAEASPASLHDGTFRSAQLLPV